MASPITHGISYPPRQATAVPPIWMPFVHQSNRERLLNKVLEM